MNRWHGILVFAAGASLFGLAGPAIAEQELKIRANIEDTNSLNQGTGELSGGSGSLDGSITLPDEDLITTEKYIADLLFSFQWKNTGKGNTIGEPPQNSEFWNYPLEPSDETPDPPYGRTTEFFFNRWVFNGVTGSGEDIATDITLFCLENCQPYNDNGTSTNGYGLGETHGYTMNLRVLGDLRTATTRPSAFSIAPDQNLGNINYVCGYDTDLDGNSCAAGENSRIDFDSFKTVPGPLPLMGAVSGFVYSQIRKRIKDSQQPIGTV